jgi:hypothetical protein
MGKYFFALIFLVSSYSGLTQTNGIQPFNIETARRFAKLAHSCISTEYANHISHTMQNANDVGTPAQLHPAFYGCYDWHSSVHGHWLLVKILKQFADFPERDSIIASIDKNITVENIAREVNYFQQPGRASFERPYGWGWLLKLSAELAEWDDPVGERWYIVLKPLAEEIVQQYNKYLPGLNYPLRRGVHANTALGLSFALDYARISGDSTFESLLVERSRFYFLNDQNIPAEWEPEGDDFLSPSLMVADLMRRVLSPVEFKLWFGKFMPDFPSNLAHPALVTAREDPTGVHLDGLNLSRAWCMFEISKALGPENKMSKKLKAAAFEHAASALPNVITENYLGTHWLATFAVYMYFTLPYNL